VSVKWRVDELTRRRGWNARELADRSGVDVKTARNILTGRATRVDLETIGRIADALGVSPGPLWRRADRGEAAGRWAAAAGAAGRADRRELEWILGRADEPIPDPALERATRRE
jgi:DNA-binding Xre family transcriptional regulator